MRDDDPLFLLSNQQSLYNYWKFYQRCNGIDPPVSLYELRHTFVSMIEDAVPPAQLRRIVGPQQEHGHLRLVLPRRHRPR